MRDQFAGHQTLCASILSAGMPEKDLADSSPLECERARMPLGQMLSNEAALVEVSEAGSRS